MFGIGYQEMFIVLVVALVIFGPSRLPELAGQVGRWVRDFRRMSADLTGEFEKTFAEVDEVKKSFQREMKSIQSEVEGVGKSARGDLKKSTAKGAGGKKPGAGTRAGSATASAKAAPAKAGAANGAKRGLLGLGRRAGASANGPMTALPMASKDDPLADVSFFDLDADLVIVSNGAAAANGPATAVGAGDDALSRVRQRRASSAYARRTGS